MRTQGIRDSTKARRDHQSRWIMVPWSKVITLMEMKDPKGKKIRHQMTTEVEVGETEVEVVAEMEEEVAEMEVAEETEPGIPPPMKSSTQPEEAMAPQPKESTTLHKVVTRHSAPKVKGILPQVLWAPAVYARRDKCTSQ